MKYLKGFNSTKLSQIHFLTIEPEKFADGQGVPGSSALLTFVNLQTILQTKVRFQSIRSQLHQQFHILHIDIRVTNNGHLYQSNGQRHVLCVGLCRDHYTIPYGPVLHICQSMAIDNIDGNRVFHIRLHSVDPNLGGSARTHSGNSVRHFPGSHQFDSGSDRYRRRLYYR